MNISKIIDEAAAVSYTICYPIQSFTIEDLIKLSEEAKDRNVELRIKAEHSNFYQGTLIAIKRIWD